MNLISRLEAVDHVDYIYMTKQRWRPVQTTRSEPQLRQTGKRPGSGLEATEGERGLE